LFERASFGQAYFSELAWQGFIRTSQFSYCGPWPTIVFCLSPWRYWQESVLFKRPTLCPNSAVFIVEHCFRVC